ncbi:MAG: peroxiredoxin [Candidatus Binatus sp.]|uniref:peroxiredoxin n=1 Tax=Candidatus Binatus sp. TaxID=2811406 RepID=UPI0027274D72|nr:peroxiredoxin [Candidatus Binatus sp.]MDO8434472.1 peroxiredoxin [Candidatus Binatus sp.]
MPPAEVNGKPDPEALELALPDQSGEIRKLADFRGRNVIVYFYPMDDTPGCTVEAKEFRDSFEQFEELGCAIVGVSTDSVARHRAFADKHDFPFILLSDEGGRLADAFGVLKGSRAARTTFVFDRGLRMRTTFRDVTPRGHAAQVLNFVRTLVESHRMLGG